MSPKKKTRMVVVIISVLIILGCSAAGIWKVYEANNERAHNTLMKAFDGDYTHEEQIEQLEKVLKLKWVTPENKIQVYTNLSIIYSLNQQYSKMIENAVTAIYMADKKEEYDYSAWNYINLSDTFMMLYDYDMAEELIDKALSYDLKDPKDQRWIRETAYIYLADLKSKIARTSESNKYLKLSMNYVVKDAYDYEEMLSKRKIIRARNFWNDGEYQSAERILKDIKEPKAEDELIIANVTIPLKEMKAKLEIVNGNLEKSRQMCDEVVKMQQERGYSAECLTFLKEIAPLYEARDPAAYSKYNVQALDLYAVVMKQESQLSADYIFTIYGSKYVKIRDEADRTRLIMMVSIIFMFMLILLLLFLQSRKQSITDVLTNTYNRRHFDSVYHKYIRKNIPFAVIMIDVDCFKDVNDSFGHDFGDEVLARLCKNFNDKKERDMKLFRMGGEEFCILYKCEKLEKAVSLAERFRLNVQKMDWEEGRRVTISAGVAFSGQTDDLYNLADQNLYHSKKSGRNKVSYTQ